MPCQPPLFLCVTLLTPKVASIYDVQAQWVEGVKTVKWHPKFPNEQKIFSRQRGWRGQQIREMPVNVVCGSPWARNIHAGGDDGENDIDLESAEGRQFSILFNSTKLVTQTQAGIMTEAEGQANKNAVEMTYVLRLMRVKLLCGASPRLRYFWHVPPANGLILHLMRRPMGFLIFRKKTKYHDWQGSLQCTSMINIESSSVRDIINTFVWLMMDDNWISIAHKKLIYPTLKGAFLVLAISATIGFSLAVFFVFMARSSCEFWQQNYIWWIQWLSIGQ